MNIETIIMLILLIVGIVGLVLIPNLGVFALGLLCVCVGIYAGIKALGG